MSRWMAAIYDGFMRGTEEACLARWRAEVLTHAEGDVLEIGSGTGANLGLYPASVDSVLLCEPDRHMRQRLEERVGGLGESGLGHAVAVSDAGADGLPFETESFDSVVSTLVLCSVRSTDASLAEIHRVLKPGGAFIFIEHVVAHDNPGRRRLQHFVEPVWKRLAGNCHVTRDTLTAIERAGLEVFDLSRESIRKAMPIVRPSIRGAARKPTG